MAQNKKHITPENSAEWLASCGFIFPTNEIELVRFNKLYGEPDPAISGNEVDPFKIVRSMEPVSKPIYNLSHIPINSHQMVARNFATDLPSHILDKMKKNQEKKPGNDDSPKEKKD